MWTQQTSFSIAIFIGGLKILICSVNLHCERDMAVNISESYLNYKRYMLSQLVRLIKQTFLGKLKTRGKISEESLW